MIHQFPEPPNVVMLGGVAVVAGTNTASSGSVTFGSSAGNVTFGMATDGYVTASAPSGGGGGAALSAGTQSVSSGTVAFANSNGITFGMSGSNQITASHNGLTTAMASNAGSNFVGLNSALTANGVSASINSSGISLNFPAFLTTAAQSSVSNISGVIAGTASNGGTATLSGNVSFSNANGVTFYTSAGNAVVGSVNTAYLPLANSNNYFYTSNNTFANSTHSHGNPTLALTNLTGTTASASNGFTISLSVNPAAAGVGVEAGTRTATTAGNIRFETGNGITFGLNAVGGSVMTASHNAITTARASNDAIGLNTAITQNGVSMTANSSGLSLNFPAFLTTAAQSSASNVSGVIAGTNSTGGTATLSGNISFSNANGVSFYTSAGNAIVGVVNTAYLPLANSNNYFYTSNNTFANSTHSHGNPTLNLTNLTGTTASNSGGFTISLSANAAAAGVGIEAGTRTATTAGNLRFETGNGITFGLNAVGGSVMTASHNALTTAMLSNAGSNFVGLNSALTANGVSASINSSGISLNFPAFLTTAAQSSASNVSGVIAGTNATGGTATLSGNISFSNANGISFYTSAGNAVVGTVKTDYQSSNANYLTSQNAQAVSGSNGSFSFQTVTFGSSNGMHFYTTNNSIVGSYTVPTIPGATVFSNSNNVSFGLNGSTVTATATFAQSQDPINLYAVSNTTQSSSGAANVSALSFAGAGVASVGITGNSVLISVPAGGAAGTQSLYAVSNTTQSTSGTYTNGLSFHGAGAASVGISNGSVVISVPVGGGAGDGYNIVSLGTTGTTGTAWSALSASVAINGSGGVVVSQNNSNQLVISGPATSSIVGTGAVSVSVNASTISIGVPNQGTITQRYGWPPGNFSVLSVMGNGSFSINRMQAEAPISATRMEVPFLLSLASSAAANTWGLRVSAFACIYTKNASTLSSLSSGSVGWSISLASNTAGSTQVIAHAVRPISVPINVNMSAGEYYIGFCISTNTSSVGTATTALGNTWSVMGIPSWTSAVPQVGEFTMATATSTGLWGGQGIHTGTFSSVPTTIGMNSINQTGSYYGRGNFGIIFRNI